MEEDTQNGLVLGRPEHEIAATVALMRVGVVPADQLGGLIDHVGSAVRILECMAGGEPLPVPGAQGRLGPLPEGEVGRALTETGAWLEAGLDIRTVLDPGYPSPLHSIFNRPPLVFLQGTWREPEDARSIAVVGTRQPSPDGIRRARRLSRELVAANYTILSGLALGIDTAVHEATIEAGGRTIAVIGTGLQRIYPASNAGLARRILECEGTILSQFLPDQPPTKWTFPKRNVVMSGLSLATVVIEAGATSGAKMQARIALEHGRSVFLLRSLVREHEWAQRYVEQGIYGTRAIEIGSPAEALECLEGDRVAVPLAV